MHCWWLVLYTCVICKAFLNFNYLSKMKIEQVSSKALYKVVYSGRL